MIDQPTIDRILDAVQIVDIVSDFVTLRKRGVNYVGLCPFHDDKTPSFYVSPSKGLCKCFSCGKGGNDDNGGKDTCRAAGVLQCAHIADHEVVAEAHHQSDDTADIPGDLLHLLLAVGFLRHVFQGGDCNGEQLHNDGSVDIRRHT